MYIRNFKNLKTINIFTSLSELYISNLATPDPQTCKVEVTAPTIQAM